MAALLTSSTTVLITGISGFIAGHLARILTASGSTVVGIGRREPSPETRAAGVQYLPCDITDRDAVSRIITNVQPQTLYHLAAHSVLTGSTAAEMLAINVTGTMHILEACRTVGVTVCVVASSDKQYGALAAPPYDDTDATAFQNGGVYELSKAQQDQTARLFAGLYETPAVRVARLINIYGPGDQQWTRIIPGTIRRTIQGEAPRITAGKAGEALREYLYVDDAIRALRQLEADAQANGNEPYRTPEGKLARVGFNIGPGTHLAAADVVRSVQKILAQEFGIVGLPPVVQAGQTGVFEPGSQFNRTEKLAALFPDGKFVPRSFEDGLLATIPWYLNHLKSAA